MFPPAPSKRDTAWARGRRRSGLSPTKNPMMRAALVHINHHLKDRFGAPEIAEAIGSTLFAIP
jgi:hypothetical protein